MTKRLETRIRKLERILKKEKKKPATTENGATAESRPAVSPKKGGFMQREIKFRAYHPDESKMYYFENFEDMGEWSAYDSYRTINKDDCLVPWMQYTGRKDKNDKEIYDGDILSGIKKWVVAWNNINLCYDIIATTEENGFKSIHRMGDYPIGKKYILGNIYENPELAGTPELEHTGIEGQEIPDWRSPDNPPKGYNGGTK